MADGRCSSMFALGLHLLQSWPNEKLSPSFDKGPSGVGLASLRARQKSTRLYSKKAKHIY